MQLVVPMAGLGQRFVDAGYVLPKPLIPVDHVPMIVRAVLDLPAVERLIFVVRAEHVRDWGLTDVLRSWFPTCRVVVAPRLTEGQACTVQLAASELKPLEPVIVAACDNSHLYDATLLDGLVRDDSTDCLIWTYRHDSRVLRAPRSVGWARTRPGTIELDLVSCKTPISDTPLEDYAISGCFYFRTAELLLEGIEALVAANERVNGEFYLDLVPNVLLRRGARVRVFEVDKYIGWGTPAELKDYQKWQRYFAARPHTFPAADAPTSVHSAA